MFSGSIPALATPFRNGMVDEDAFRAFVDWQIDQGSAALVPCGTTGEAATMPKDEHFRVVRLCVEQAAARVPVIAGAGSNDTRVACENIRAAKEAGADAVLMVPPYYNRPGQEGIFRHFEAVVESCDLPIVLYNVPGRTVTDIEVATMGRLANAFPSIVAVKDATGILSRVSAQRAACGPDFCQLSGNDETAIGFMATGGKGCVSVTANVAPRLCAEFQAACAAGDYSLALDYQDRLFALHLAMFADASPGPVKYAISRVRPDFPTELRLPMVEPNDAAKRVVDAALEAAGLI
ncbi:4-hydroxy-tetrahydrodipicolinate synthase [Stakelama pacifica]|uniref:4-hydroxy-tetrahydrodipicolinate synthase n=1 Tax=Stakelama pacifica TaxID=517720 RepID=A0A4R6FXI1_9SPHN|nr:4-hydroxy-tetrahydrodipicolinate synthase [Stakelama pacifica]TDN86696.1 dihydrodipicolinate synthase [Stakelama pacifica]GGO90403.1 4-hydroxy-tetrahydrodipicolinate synthase [Stakelama pacifica]